MLGLVGMEVCGECWMSLGQRDKFGSTFLVFAMPPIIYLLETFNSFNGG